MSKKMAVRLIVGRYDGETDALVAGCIDSTLWEIVGDDDWQKWTREIQDRFSGDARGHYEWREVEGHFDQAALNALFDHAPIVGEVVGEATWKIALDDALAAGGETEKLPRCVSADRPCQSLLERATGTRQQGVCRRCPNRAGGETETPPPEILKTALESWLRDVPPGAPSGVWYADALGALDSVVALVEAQARIIEAARESVRREARSDYKSIYEAPTRIIGPVRDALARFDRDVR